jgi:hypothetical protein
MSKIQQTQQTHAQTAAKANKPQQAQQKSFNPAQLFESPESMRSEDVLAAQQTVGNQVVQRALDKDDRRKGLTDNQGNLRQDLNEQIQQKRGGGSPLPENIQKEASKKLGRNFKDVRIHTDESADKLSRTISARAFTIGKDIFFKNGVFAPGSGAGRETIMHELTHVVQQGGRSGASGALKLGAPDTAHEKEADRIGKKHAASVGAAPAGAVQREGEEDELMMQSAPEEEELLQMQGEEDELQMQEDEEELQMQPDNTNTIQRALEDEIKAEIANRRKDAGSRKKRNKGMQDSITKIDQDIQDKSLDKSSLALAKQNSAKANFLSGELDTKRKSMGIGSKENLGKLEKLDKNREKKDTQRIKTQDKEEKQQQKESNRNKLMQVIQNPKSSSEDVAAAEEKLNMLHKRSKSDKFSSFFTGKSTEEYSKQAKSQREKSLRSLAERGDEDAYKNMKTESAAQAAEEAEKKKNSKGAKVKGALGSVGGFLKRRLGALDEHVFGKEEEKEDKDAKAGGGSGGTSEMIAELYQENKKLKAQITELEKAKV